MDSNKQMEMLFEEGGIADDGMDRDPVSGNEVPSGSLAEEVRDDIPAQLSEGEYVVPADVVRYFGVKFFEDLRSQAKMGLGDMERNGRIGGEPVAMEREIEDDVPLSPEEEAELASIMQMAVGGMVPTQAPNPYAQQMTFYTNPNAPKGYNEGGLELPPETQVTFDPSQFQPGFSFMGQTPGQNMPTIEPNRNVTLYGPNGEVAVVMIPAQQELYDQYIEQGYTETQQVTTPVEEAQQQQATGQDDRDFSTAQQDLRDRLNDVPGSAFDREELTSLEEDPLGYADSMLNEDTLDPKKAGGIASMFAPGMGLLVGGMAAAAGLDNIARARAASQYASNKLGLDTTAIDNRINVALENAPRSVRFLDFLGFGQGTRYARDLNARLSSSPVFERPSWMGGSPSTAAQNARSRLGDLTGPAAAYAEDQIRTGYTGSSVNDIAVGNISGDGQIEGVVANEDGTVVRDSRNRTVFRDEQGSTYVRSGAFGQRREYVDIDGVSQNPEEINRSSNSGGGSSSNNSGGSDRAGGGGGGYTSIKDMFDGGGPGQDRHGNPN